MYSRCIYCKARLGSNEAVEHFPVGKRLAFDSYRGRLWVVCIRCSSWNLTPLEERWEAVEECERLFEGTRLRASTENIGLARVRAGVDLVRIGEARRPEFAAWRYASRIRRRHRGSVLVGGVGVAYLGAAGITGTTILSPWLMAPLMGMIAGLTYWPQYLGEVRTIMRVKLQNDQSSEVRGSDVAKVRLMPALSASRWRLEVPHAVGTAEIEGLEAVHAAAQLFAYTNAAGAGQKKVQAAVRELERVDHPEAYFEAAAKQLGSRILEPGETRHEIAQLSHEARLALEMAAHEEVERQALDGELLLLEAAWRQAEEIAAIADNLFVSPLIERLVGRYRASDGAIGQSSENSQAEDGDRLRSKGG